MDRQAVFPNMQQTKVTLLHCVHYNTYNTPIMFSLQFKCGLAPRPQLLPTISSQKLFSMQH